MSRHDTHAFAMWVVDVLTDGGLHVGLGGKPDNVPNDKAWAVVFPIAGGVVEGSVNDPNSDATPDIQVSSLSYHAEQALRHVRTVRNLLLDAIPATLSDGRRVVFGEPTFADPTLSRDDDKQPPVWYCPDRLSFRTAA